MCIFEVFFPLVWKNWAKSQSWPLHDKTVVLPVMSCLNCNFVDAGVGGDAVYFFCSESSWHKHIIWRECPLIVAMLLLSCHVAIIPHPVTVSAVSHCANFLSVFVGVSDHRRNFSRCDVCVWLLLSLSLVIRSNQIPHNGDCVSCFCINFFIS